MASLTIEQGLRENDERQRPALTPNPFPNFRGAEGNKSPPFSIAHILANGDVPLCANDWQNRELLGNVKEQSLREIFNSPRIEEIQELMREERYEEIAPCRDCSLWKEWRS